MRHLSLKVISAWLGIGWDKWHVDVLPREVRRRRHVLLEPRQEIPPASVTLGRCVLLYRISSLDWRFHVNRVFGLMPKHPRSIFFYGLRDQAPENSLACSPVFCLSFVWGACTLFRNRAQEEIHFFLKKIFLRQIPSSTWDIYVPFP